MFPPMCGGSTLLLQERSRRGQRAWKQVGDGEEGRGE